MAKIGEIRAVIKLDNSNFNKGMDEAKGKMGGLSDSAKNVKRDLDAVQKASGIMASAIAAGVGASVNVARNFEQSMSRVKAIANSTDEEFKRLEQTARDLGSTTSFSAIEASEGMQMLLMAGFDTTETIAAMPGVLRLASAAQESLGTSADAVSNILSGFGLNADSADAAVDALVTTMTTANTNLPQLADAMKYVAPVSAGLGISLESTAAAIGKMSDAGIQGSSAGTALRAMLLSLANPTGQTAKAMEEFGIEVIGADGAMKPLPELVGHIAEKLDGLGEANKTAAVAQLTGTEAASGFLALMEVGEDGLASYTAELENSEGAAQRMAETQEDNLNGAFKQFQSALEEVGIAVGNEFLPAFREIVEVGTDVVRFIGELDTDMIASIATFAGVSAGIGFLITTLGKLTIALRGTMMALGPAGWAVVGLSMLGGLLTSVSADTENLGEVNLELADSMAETNAGLRDSLGAFEELSGKSKLTSDEFMRFLDLQKLIDEAVDDSKIAELTEEQQALLEKSGLSNDEMQRMVDLNGYLVDTVPEATGAISDQGERVITTTDALREYSDQLEGATLRELERQRIIAEGKEVENKEKMVDLQTKLDEGMAKEAQYREEFRNFDEQASLAKIEKMELQLQSEELTARERQSLSHNLEIEKEKLETNREQLTKQMEKNDKTREQIEELGVELGKVNEIDAKMLEVIMTQQGLNAEKGKEIETLDKALGKLDTQKQKLYDQTPINERNTGEFQAQVSEIDNQISGLQEAREKVLNIYAGSELLTGELHDQSGAIGDQIRQFQAERAEMYKNTPVAQQQTEEFRRGIAAIDGQIAELQGVRGQIQSAIGEASTLNSVLSSGIVKTVTIKKIGGNMREGGRSIKPLPGLDFHTGGILGGTPLNRAALPKLHKGGTTSEALAAADRLRGKFSPPMQHEVDIRALKGEMMLTESQQANLMRMIDAGHTPRGGGDMSETNALLRDIKAGLDDGKDIQIVMNERQVARAITPHITERQQHDSAIERQYRGGRN